MRYLLLLFILFTSVYAFEDPPLPLDHPEALLSLEENLSLPTLMGRKISPLSSKKIKKQPDYLRNSLRTKKIKVVTSPISKKRNKASY